MIYFFQKTISLFRSIPYYLNIRKSVRFNARTISIGNISFGGSGKTTLVSFIAKKLLAANESVVILSRGYKRKSKDTFIIPSMEDSSSVKDMGDEPYMLKKNLSRASLVVSKDRIKEAYKNWNLVSSKYVLLDDGFQHWKAERDLDVLLFNLKQWGKLGREPLEASARANCFVLTQWEGTGEEKIKDIVCDLVKINFSFQKKVPWQKEGLPRSFPRVFFLSYQALGLFQGSKLLYSQETLSQKKVILLHGLASDSSIRASVEGLGISVLEEFSFPDHHWIKKDEVQRVYAALEKLRKESEKNSESEAPFLLCTEKDYYRWLEAFSFCQEHFYYLKIEAAFQAPFSMEGVIGGETDFLNLIKGLGFGSK